MKKSSVFIMVVLAIMLASYSASFAESYFSNNPALNSIFATLEKTFLQYKRDEVIPLRSLGAIITDPNEPRITRTSKKITDAQVKAAAEKALNDIRVAVEIKEEELGGLTPADYKIIADHFTDQIFWAKNSDYGWDFDGKYVQLYFDLGVPHEWDYIKNLTGNFAKMGKEKDEVNPADLKVKNKIIRYLNQSMQKGNKIAPEVMEKFPGEVERLFIEYDLSRIEAAAALSRLHDEIYNPQLDNSYADQYDGSTSIEDLVESCEATLRITRSEREQQKKIDYYQYQADVPSSKAKETITKALVREDLPESFSYGFNKAVTLNDLAQLYFESNELSAKIIVDAPGFDANTPDYLKQAFAYGMIHDLKDLNKPLTRLEAARILVNGAIYHHGFWNALGVVDATAIPLEDQITVATCLHGYMNPVGDRFEPQSSYTKEQAILDRNAFYFENLRGYHIPSSLRDVSKIILGKDTINILFENKDQLQEYIEDELSDTLLRNIKINKSYTKIDTGGALIELFTPENGIKFTMKNGVTYFDLEEGYYGPGVSYALEPVVLKGNEKVDMNARMTDSNHKKLYAKLDPILAKIIKPGMTTEQKIKAIHDFVVLHITYDLKYLDVDNLENLMISIDKGRGVCGDYSLLFMHLCRRINIPATYEVDPFIRNHAWNSVLINGQWLFVDCTWDDKDNGKVLYTYFLKDRFTFMKDHTPYMGVPDPDYYTDVDPMNIKTQDELRGYLLSNFYWVNGYKMTFRMADKTVKPIITYLNDPYVSISLTYDAKADLYTVSAKGK